MNVLEVLTKLVVGTGKVGDYLLSRKASGLLVASLAFACGVLLVYEPKPAPRAKTADEPPPVVKTPPREAAAPPAPAEAAPSYEEEVEYDTRELQEWKHMHGGASLPLDYDSLPRWSRLSESKVAVLPSGRTLAAAGAALYMLDADRRVRWKYDMPQPIIDFAYVAETGVVCGTAYDNHMFILDAATGRVLVSDSRNGRAGFGAVLKYGDGVCLIADALGGYNVEHRGGEPTMDGVTAWRGSRMLWQASAPPDAELQVVGSKIYAVTRTQTRILVKEIKPPKGGR